MAEVEQYPAAFTARWPERTVATITTMARAIPLALVGRAWARRKAMNFPIQTTG